MEKNPNKPRMWLDDERIAADTFFKSPGDNRLSDAPMNAIAGMPLADLTPAEQAGVLCTDADVREELLRSLKGGAPRKPQQNSI